MARQESVSKLLYYPTPGTQVQLIASWFTNPTRSRLVDPCCGEGEALSLLKDLIAGNAETWGIELSPQRAEKAAKLLDKVLPTSFYDAQWWDRSASLIFLNPPYDWSDQRDEQGKRERHEKLFITRTVKRLVPGGHVVVIIPQSQLLDEQLARTITGWYENLMIFRFAGDEFDQFKQVIIIGTRRPAYHAPTDLQVELVTNCGKVPLVEIYPGDGRYIIPPTPEENTFRFIPVTSEALASLTSQCNPLVTHDWTRLTHVRPIGAPIHPVLQEKIGHVAMELSSGDVGVIRIETEEGPALAKGTLVKQAIRTEEIKCGEDGQASKNITELEKLATHISITRPDGDITTITTASEVAEFMTKHGSAIADALLMRNTPIYDFKPTKREWDITTKIAKGLPALPGRKERGLFPMQAHLAIATARELRIHHHGLMNCDMGFGKTATAIATAELINEWPILVMCPDHMVEKWRRDIERVSNTADPIKAMIVDTAARAGASWFETEFRPEAERLFCTIAKYERIQVEPVEGQHEGRRIRALVQGLDGNQDKLLKWMSQHKLTPKLIKLAFVQGDPGNMPARVVEFNDRDAYTLVDFFQDYDSGKLGRKAAVVCAFDPAKHDSGFVPVTVLATRRIPNNDGQMESKRVPTCPQCGAWIVDPEQRQCRNVITGRVKMQDGTYKPHSHPCGAFLHQMTRWRRTGIAHLVATKYVHRIKLYIADEIHKCKSGDTDIGTADGRFISSIKYSIALTGTLFGGAASSLFYILYRRSRGIRTTYDFKDGHNLWVDHYGIWERKWTERENDKGPRGVTTGIKRFQVRSTEKPGISPSVIRHILPQVIFGKITDLGYELPGLQEQIISVAMSARQAEQYDSADSYLLDLAKRELAVHHDMAYVSAWFSTVRSRPNSAFRDEQAICRGSILMELPAVVNDNQPLPKETKLAEIVQENMAHNRKTLVFAEQTATRDIRPRLEVMLRQLAPSARVGILNSTLKPKKRERWIENNAPALDVLIVNPKLVETGLDLVMFQEIVFFEITYSLYTLWQAMRRVWRLGQAKTVRTTFLVYKGTVEQAALDIMGTKMKYAMMLYGDNASGVLVDDSGDDDIERMMIAQALEGKTYESLGDLNHLFTTDEQRPAMDITDSPMGSPTAVSPRMPTLDPEPALKTWAAMQNFVPLKKVRKVTVNTAQVSMF